MFYRSLCSLFVISVCLHFVLPAKAQRKDLKLWFTRGSADWNEALPIGNGRLGAMIFGGVTSERLQLNEETVWTGKDVDFVNAAAKAALPQIRKLLFEGRYAEAQNMALTNTIAASKVLSHDAAFAKKLQRSLNRLAPTKIGRDGRIMEWTEEFAEAEPGHRHISHLFGLYPGKEINVKTPQLLQAARKTIDYRLSHGGGHTGWSRAWIINYFARLQDGEAAYQNVLALLRKSTLPNLFDNHSPFQIDGNFGTTAGITEMLLQSQANEIQLLPALPKAWPKGYIHGIVARGGFNIDIDWEDGRLNR